MRVQNFQVVSVNDSSQWFILLKASCLALSFRYGAQCVCINTLSVYTKTMSTEAGIDTGDRRIVSHSARVTCCTRLYNALKVRMAK